MRRTLQRTLPDLQGFWPVGLALLALAICTPFVMLAIPLTERQLIDGVILANRLDLLVPTVAWYAVLWLGTIVAGIAVGLLRTYLGERLLMRLRERLLAHQRALSLGFSRQEHSGRMMALFTNDVPMVAGLIGTTVVPAISTLVGVVIGVGVMLSLSWQLAVVGGLAPPLVAGLALVATRPLRPRARRIQDKAAEIIERVQESLSGIREIAAFGQERAQGRRFTAALEELLRMRMRLTLFESGLQFGQSLFWIAVSLVVLGFGAYLVIQGETTLGAVVAMRTVMSQVFQPILNLAGLVASAQRSLAASDRVYTFLDEQPRVAERDGARSPGPLVGTVAFDRVSFSYVPERVVLEDISFKAASGEVVALVGPSGGGKSTLVSLIPRFYDPTAGRVLVGGLDLRDLTIEGLRSRVGIVFQDSFLFSTTVRDNIAFGRDGANQAEIVAAAQAANAWEFIEQLPRGLDTQVGERGVRLSEGQKQRIAIARALLRDPRILILDEPTSALDARSEHLLQLALENLMRGRTTFVIAHRLATVRRADQILVLDQGRIVQRGTHRELVAQVGLYRDLYQLQFSVEPVIEPGGLAGQGIAVVANATQGLDPSPAKRPNPPAAI